MDWKKILAPIVVLAMLYAGWTAGGWAGVAFAVGAMVMFALLQIQRMVAVLRRAAKHPKGHVGSAVMLNAKLKKGVNLLHVMAMTQSIGEALSEEGADPEYFRWTDDSGASVTCEFARGKLAKWSLDRPTGFVASEAAPSKSPEP